jgi:L-rhamnose-H+ transport protein
MENSPIFGLVVILFGGFFEGIFMLPEKWCKGWKFEHIWLTFSFFCYFLLPWVIVRLSVPNVSAVFAATPKQDLLLMGLYACGWALAALSFGIGINLIGVSLGFAIIFGLAAFVGALVPLLTSSVPPAKFLAVLLCLVLMLVGVSLCSFAGRWRERLNHGGYLKGVIFCVVSGLLGATGNMGFVAGTSLVAAARAQGLSLFASNSLVLAYLCIFMFVFNGGYALFLLVRNSSFSVFFVPAQSRYFLFTLLMGIFWMIGFLSYGYGALALGKLGLSLGWGVFMCTVVASANGVGILTGEWQAAPSSSKRRLAYGLAALILAIAGLAASNTMV